MSLRVTFSNSITFPMFDEYGSDAFRDTESVFRPVSYVACRLVLSNVTF